MILLTIPFWPDNAAATEQLLEFIFAQNDRQQIKGHVLLANLVTVDKEMVARIKIGAELAFAGVHQFEIRPLPDERAPKWKQINNAFTQAATHISREFRWPFLWFEPDCVPLRRGWLPRMVTEYASQPKAYFGTRLKIEMPGKPDSFLMARNGIYPVNAATDLAVAEAPFEIASATKIFPKFTISKLIQQAVINNESDLAKLRPDAVILHGDKHGFLRRELEAQFAPTQIEFPPKESEPEVNKIPVMEEAPPVVQPITINGKPKRGRPRKVNLDNRLAEVTAGLTQPESRGNPVLNHDLLEKSTAALSR